MGYVYRHRGYLAGLHALSIVHFPYVVINGPLKAGFAMFASLLLLVSLPLLSFAHTVHTFSSRAK